MKKIIAATFISVLLMTAAQAQTLGKKEAQQLLEKAWRCMVTSDSGAFMNLWQTDNTASAKQKITEELNFLREFLDTALARNLTIDNVEVEKHNLKNTDTEYWIKAWFRYDEHYYKGFGLYVAYKNNQWIVRGSPSTSARRKN
ncbi:MAG TPA: hypothetical protein VI757_04955 [Bacteroidia bacterium]|nr:hypothetical protein [Bacteroidia bacterium]